jgi:hypothetical protein
MHSIRPAAANIRWMDYARRSMQRVGFVKWLLSIASASHAQSLESLTRAFYAAVTAIKPIPEDQRASYSAYARSQLHRQAKQELDSAQIQYLYLSDPSLPSQSGAITGELDQKGYRHAVYVEIPTWASRLLLVRRQNYTLTDRGRVFSIAGSKSTPDVNPRINPLILDVGERYVALFSILDADGDFMRALFSRLLQRSSFTRTDVGSSAIEAMEDLRNDSRLRRASVGPLLVLRSKLDKSIEAAQNQRPSGLGPRESIATPRTEPLVDCGILSKPVRDSYDYRFTPWGKSFIARLVSAGSMDEFLESRLSAAMAELTHQPVADEPRLATVEKAYNALKTGIGYVSLRELAVLAVAQGLSAPDVDLFEIATIERVIKRHAAEGNRYVRLAAGRMGGIAQVRIHQRAFSDE